MVVVSHYESYPQVNNAGGAPSSAVSADSRVRAEIGSATFCGRVIGTGYDGEPVVYVEDTAGHERAVRFQRETHDVRATEEGSV